MSHDAFPQPICQQIWDAKYRLTTMNPDITDDRNVIDTWCRIAEACANAPHALTHGKPGPMARRSEDQDDFLDILDDFKFLPAGRIIAGAGSGRNVTLFNCYVMGTIPDNIDGIFEMLQEAALTMQQGGGIGYDFSTLRPSGSPVKGVDADASGPLSFMDVWDSMCRTIMSAGARRGAMMATMRCDHPDIEKFIVAKKDTNKLRMFNLSVLCTNAFMQAVQADDDWELVHKKPSIATFDQSEMLDPETNLYLHKIIRARELWDLIMQSTYDQAEPGVIFIDVINQMNNLWYCEEIASTNPCGEQPLPPYGACLLGSVNLAKMVVDPFVPNSHVDFIKIKNTAAVAVRMLDSVIDISNFPLEAQKEEAIDKRRMGIGITGLADMLFMLNKTYGSVEAATIASQVMRTITLACYEESIELAEEYGPCPATETSQQREKFIQSGFMQLMPQHIRDGVLKHGIRNALLTSIAPTGTISLYAGNVSSGIEPIFAAEYIRKVLEDDGVTRREEKVQDYAVHLLHNMKKNTQFPQWEKQMMDTLVTAQTLTPADHLKMQAAVQPWVDSSISKTINVPKDISFENFKEIYLEAYTLGLKGCTTYRPNDVTGSVLSVESDEAPAYTTDAQDKGVSLEQPSHYAHPITEPMDRPQNLIGTTYRLRWDSRSFFVTINDYVNHEGDPIPFEIFINSSEMASIQWTTALTRMISAVFRRGGDVDFIGEELKRISDPNGGFWHNKKFVPSFVALIGQTIENHITGMAPSNDIEEVPFKTAQEMFPTEELAQMDRKTLKCCPKCYEFALAPGSGCETCTSCGYSKCG